MNSPVEDRLREAFLEGGAESEAGALRRLVVPDGRWMRMGMRLAVVAAAVVVAEAGTVWNVTASHADERAAVATARTRVPVRADVLVFLCTGREKDHELCHRRAATEEQKKALAASLREVPGVAKVTFEDRRTAFKRFRTAFAGQSDIVSKVRAADVPESYQVTVLPGTKLERVVAAAKRMPRVALVSDRTMTDGYNPARFKGADDVTVFLCGASSPEPSCKKYERSKTLKRGKGVTADDRKKLGREIKAMPEVKKVDFEDQAEAYASFRKEFADNKALLAVTSASDMPESFRIQLESDTDSSKVAATLEKRPGVAQAMDMRCFAAGTRLSTDHGIEREGICG
ncbi:permease-like cell division protein FtsX [Nonomuraea sp. NPDC005501]|uniref:permease-like cell division protein FtsX n=1 Tax=Nonomuraea sp. NPDC005501 TaxID=3156884 RepID=UPI0033A3788B